MKTLLAALAISLALPAAAHAADNAMDKCCCCETMKHDGKDCCDEKTAEKKGEHAGHEGHAGHEMPAPQAPAN